MASKFSWYALIFIVGWIILSSIFTILGVADDFPLLSIGLIILIGPLLGIVVLVPGIIGYKRGEEIKKAKVGIIAGALLLFISISAIITIAIWLDGFGGTFVD